MQTRRQFLGRAGGAAAVTVLAPQSAAAAPAAPRSQAARVFRGGRFAQGVASGDPTPRSIVLWTAVDEVRGSGSVVLEVARDPDFRRVVARRRIATDARRAHTVKARVSNLRPYERYYYRFETRGESSPVGRFRTALPADSRQPVRFAFFSCADYTHGYFNAYDVMAREDDIDFVVNLGDYFYAESEHSRARGTGVREDRIGREIEGSRFAVTLSDYRAKYALYRSDPALRRMHARFPVISVWDDHEIANNYAGNVPGGGLPPDKRFDARRPVATRAYFEHMPVFPSAGSRIYRALGFGRTVDLLMLDERQYRDDQPCGDAVNAPDCGERAGDRAFLGNRQLAWFKDRLSRSQATWKVVGNQVLIMGVKSAADRIGVFDTWQGYLQEREDVISHIGNNSIGGVVFATGDFHIFAAGDVRPGESADPATTVASEFHGGSISAQSLGEGQAGIVPGASDRAPTTDQAILDFFEGINPWLDHADIDHHGYGLIEATAQELKVRFRRIQTIKRRGALDRLPDLTWTVQPGRPSVKGQDGRG